MGETVVLKVGKLVPVDSVVDDEFGKFDELLFNSEPLPVEKKNGILVTTGFSLVSGYLEVYTTRSENGTYVSPLIQDVNDTLIFNNFSDNFLIWLRQKFLLEYLPCCFTL